MAQVRKSRVEALVEQIAVLSSEELAELGQRLLGMPSDVWHHLEVATGLYMGGGKGHSILELKGLGREFWRSMDVDAYLDEERNAWGS